MPKITLEKTADGIDFKELKGKVVLLNFLQLGVLHVKPKSPI